MTRVLLLSVIIIISSVTSLPPKTECHFEGKVRDQDHCTSFLECDHGILIKGVCQAGHYFSPTFSDCLRVPENECAIDPAGFDLTNQTCPVIGDKLPGYLSCETYFHCKGGVYVEEECPSHKSFSVRARACVDNDFDEACHLHSSYFDTQTYISSEASPYERKCAIGSSGLQADPSDCRLFVKCLWQGNKMAQLLIGECEIGKLFDEETKTCKEAELVLCGERFRNNDIYGSEKSERWRRDPRKSMKSGSPSINLRPKPGRYVMWNQHPHTKITPSVMKTKTVETKAKTAQATTTKPKEGQAGRGIIFGGKPRRGNLSGIFQNAKTDPLLQNEGFPDLSIPKIPSNTLLRKKRRVKTKVRKTETEFFDEQGNFTNVTKNEYSNVRPKMRVRLIETETIYDGSDEDKVKSFGKNKTPEQIALKIEKDLDGLTNSPTPGSPSGRAAIGSGVSENRDILPTRSSAHTNTMHRKKMHPRPTIPPLQPVHYMEYEAPPGVEDEFSLNLPQE